MFFFYYNDLTLISVNEKEALARDILLPSVCQSHAAAISHPKNNIRKPTELDKRKKEKKKIHE